MIIRVRHQNGHTIERELHQMYTLAQIVQGIDEAIAKQAQAIIQLEHGPPQLVIDPNVTAAIAVLEQP